MAHFLKSPLIGAGKVQAKAGMFFARFCADSAPDSGRRSFPYLNPRKRRKDNAAKRMAQGARAMAKGMNKQGKNVKKPKKDKAQAAVVVVPSTKNSVNISGGKPRE